MSTAVPLVDLQWQHRVIADDVAAGFARVMETTAFIQGSDVREFETEFAAFSGVRHCIGVANGTDALELIVRTVGAGPGDEVILPANTFIATALAVVRAGATPVFVDVDPDCQLVSVAAVERALTRQSKAILPVHLFGQMAPMAPLRALADGAGVALLEDAAQAQGAAQDGVGAGGFGLATGTSFYPGKNLGAYGDAGAVLTDSDEVAAKVRALRNYGSETKYHHPEPGFNSRLDTLQAVVLRAKLKHLTDWNALRQRAAEIYDELLADLPAVARPQTLARNRHVWHLYVVRVPQRDRVLQQLNAAGIGAGIHYPVPIHLQGAFRDHGHRPGDFPVAEQAANEILSLPLFPGITRPQQERVVDELRRALA